MQVYKRKIHVYETDLMGIVHHSNYLRFCEEARIDWCEKYLNPILAAENTSNKFANENVYGLTVVETQVQHKFPLKYPTEVVVHYEAQIHGATLHYDYKILDSEGRLCAVVKTIHCSVNEALKPKRLNSQLVKAVESYQIKK